MQDSKRGSAPSGQPRPRALDRPIVRIGGKEHLDWDDYSIDSDLFTPADAFSFSLRVPARELPEEVTPWAEVTISLDSDTVLTGRIDSISRTTRKGERSLQLQGRDLAAVLVDCSAPIFVTRETDLEDIIAKIVRPLGIAKIDIRASGTREKITVEPGMSAWDALERVCEQNGCAAWFDPAGTLIVGGPDYSAEPVAELLLTLDRARTNVLSLEIAEDLTDTYSEVTILGQTHGTESAAGRNALRHTVRNDVLAGVNRPLIVVDSECDSADLAARRARKTIADAALNALTITAEVRGHRTSGGLVWTPGQRVRLTSEPDGLDGVYYLVRRTLRGGRESGQRTTLTLKVDGVWLPDLAKGKPKQAGSGKGKNKDKSNLRIVDLGETKDSGQGGSLGNGDGRVPELAQ